MVDGVTRALSFVEAAHSPCGPPGLLSLVAISRWHVSVRAVFASYRRSVACVMMEIAFWTAACATCHRDRIPFPVVLCFCSRGRTCSLNTFLRCACSCNLALTACPPYRMRWRRPRLRLPLTLTPPWLRLSASSKGHFETLPRNGG
jgi:hypothetical protein